MTSGLMLALVVEKESGANERIVLSYSTSTDLVQRSGPGEMTPAGLSLLFHDLVAAVRQYAIEVERMRQAQPAAKETIGS